MRAKVAGFYAHRMDSHFSIPQISISPGYISLWNQWQGPKRKKISQPSVEPDDNVEKNDRPEQFEDNRSYGVMSKVTQRKVCKIIDWLILMADEKFYKAIGYKTGVRFRINFVTLTLSSAQIHTDDQIKKQLLQPFLKIAGRKWNLKNYVQRSEAQYNGNIHFHLITDKFIPHDQLRNVWNNLQARLGYIDRYREERKAFHKSGFRVQTELLYRWTYNEQKNAFKKGMSHNWSSPNSTDVHKVKNINNLSAYLCKYCVKNSPVKPVPVDWKEVQEPDGRNLADQTAEITRNDPDARRMIEGRVWSCNYELSRCRAWRDDLTDTIRDEINSLMDRFPRYVKHYDYHTVFYMPFSKWVLEPVTHLYYEFMQHLQQGAVPKVHRDRAPGPQIAPLLPAKPSFVQTLLFSNITSRLQPVRSLYND